MELCNNKTNELREEAKIINLDENAKKSISIVKEIIGKTNMLAHQATGAPISIAVDTFTWVIEGVVQQ